MIPTEKLTGILKFSYKRGKKKVPESARSLKIGIQSTNAEKNPNHSPQVRNIKLAKHPSNTRIRPPKATGNQVGIIGIVIPPALLMSYDTTSAITKPINHLKNEAAP